MPELERDTLFIALTRPQLLLGVSYGVFVLNAVITAEVFLVFRTFSALLVAILAHCLAWVVTRANPHFLDLWVTTARLCPRVPNYPIWRCNSYRP